MDWEYRGQHQENDDRERTGDGVSQEHGDFKPKQLKHNPH